MSLYRGAGGASDATDDSTVNAVAGYASSAASSATAAAASASTASGNASAAAASAAAAATSVSQAAASAATAESASTFATGRATSAFNSAASATSAASAANVSAGSAATSAANAATSNSSASTHATNAANSATAAAGSATSAANSAASALAIYGNTAAMNEAVADAVEAAANAQQEAQDASDSAVASAASAAAADEHENNAAEWASQAQGSANSAQGFATAAQAARDATLEAYDSFDDRYLGVKTSDPTVDNDGNPLVPGALYFNSSTNMMMLRAGGVWVAAYTSGGSPSFGNTVVNGTLNVTGVSTFSAGTAAAPAITTTGDTNTGIFFPAADTIAFSEGGVESMRLDANGNLGIRTTAPSNTAGYGTLSVNGSTGGQVAFQTGGTAFQFIYSTSTDLNIFNQVATGNLRFHTNSTERMRLDASGNLGLGVTPTNVAGTRKLEVGGTTGAALVLNTASGNTAARNWATAANSNVFGDFNILQSNALGGDPIAAGTARMTFSPAGNVGIGTTSPAARLSVSTTGAQVDISTSATQVSFEAIDRAAISNPVDMRFFARNGTFQWHNSSYAERMRLDATGNVSIGTTAAPARLSVSGTAAAVGYFENVTTTGAVNSAQIRLASFDGAAVSAGTFVIETANSWASTTFAGGAANTSVFQGAKAGGVAIIAASGSAPIKFFTGGEASTSERARIDSSGNLLVGTTTAFNSAHSILKGTSTNDLQLTVGGNASVPGVAIHYGNNTGTANAANSVIKVGLMNVTARSISAAGTINASGADYAEYMTKAGDFTIAKGDVVGINAEGKLTNVFADAISFCVKSTDPSYVGGDSWGCGLDNDPEALEAARQQVDRIAFAGQVPVNVLGATPGQYIVPIEDAGAIKGIAKNEGDMTIVDYMKAIGKVISIQEDGRAFIIVKVA